MATYKKWAHSKEPATMKCFWKAALAKENGND